MAKLEYKQTSKHTSSPYFSNDSAHSPDEVIKKLCEVLDSLHYWKGEAANLAARLERAETENAQMKARFVTLPYGGKVS